MASVTIRAWSVRELDFQIQAAELSHCCMKRAPKIQLQFEPSLTPSMAKCHSVGDIGEIRRNFLQERVSRRRLRPVTRIFKLASSLVRFQSVDIEPKNENPHRSTPGS